MTAQQEFDILEDPQIQDIQQQLRTAGAPVDTITKWALAEGTKGLNPGTAAATRIVAECLLKRLREIEDAKKPRSFVGKVWKFLLTGTWTK